MLRAYCDASKRDGRMAIAGIITMGNLFVDYDLRILDDVKYTSQAELQAIILLFEMISRHFDTKQVVAVYSDNSSIVQQFSMTVKTGKIPTNRAHYEDWITLKQLCQGHTVFVNYVKSHLNKRTCHFVCDCSARAILKR